MRIREGAGAGIGTKQGRTVAGWGTSGHYKHTSHGRNNQGKIWLKNVIQTPRDHPATSRVASLRVRAGGQTNGLHSRRDLFSLSAWRDTTPRVTRPLRFSSEGNRFVGLSAACDDLWDRMREERPGNRGSDHASFSIVTQACPCNPQPGRDPIQTEQIETRRIALAIG